MRIFGDYIRNIFSVDEQKIAEDFDDINCEGLYKLFILSMKHDIVTQSANTKKRTSLY